MGHIEISSFSAFDERRSVPRDVIYIYPPKKITKGKMFPSSLTWFVCKWYVNICDCMDSRVLFFLWQVSLCICFVNVKNAFIFFVAILIFSFLFFLWLIHFCFVLFCFFFNKFFFYCFLLCLFVFVFVFILIILFYLIIFFYCFFFLW
jgi:hypothetical protein